MSTEIIVGGLYASQDSNGRYVVTKVLVLEEQIVHLRTYADRFDHLPSGVHSSSLSLGGMNSARGFGIGHFPLAREAYEREEHMLVGRESVGDDELDGYRIWAGIDSFED